MIDLQSHHDGHVVVEAQRALLSAVLDKGFATADDVRAAVPLPVGINPKVFGLVPGPLARAGIIRKVGHAKTRRRIAHAREVTVWELLNRKKAEQWLWDHPARPSQNDQPDATAATVAPGRFF